MSANSKHDWTSESWVDEDGPTDLDMHQAFHIMTALAAIGEEAKLVSLLRPDICERIWKSEAADEIVNNRLQQAMAQSLSMIRMQWIEQYGSADAKGSSA